ncbi:MAG: C40 family peptidase [Muribaculaceae bacterium]|nr:C40 family peptidase [Muribaculaceae bacterium]
MKRKLLHFLILFAAATVAVSLPSCRSAKKSESSFYETQYGGNRKGRHKNAKNGNDGKNLPISNNKIVNEAYTWIGTPYGYAKAEKGKACDCSGMVMSVYEKVTGVKLPRNSAQQQDFCKKLKKNDVRPGDLCFFATGKDPDKTSHVGIMVDDNNFIHSSTSKGVVVSDITQPYWIKTFTGFGRVPD